MAKMPKLTEMLQNSPEFTDPEHEDFVPIDQQAATMVLAEAFQKSISHLYMDSEELEDEIGIGNSEAWEKFLLLDPVSLYVTARTKSLAAVSARKSMKNLQKAAATGDVAAIRYLNDVSGILQGQSNNKLIVMHYIPRPQRPGKLKEV